MFQGFYLREFANHLTQMHEGARTRAELCNWDGVELLRVYAAGPRRNKIRIAGRLGDGLWHNADDWRGREPQPADDVGLRIVFNDLEIPREDLLRIVRQINEYIHAYGVDCEI